MRLHTHSMGIISQWLAMNAVSECCFTNAVLIPDGTKEKIPIQYHLKVRKTKRVVYKMLLLCGQTRVHVLTHVPQSEWNVPVRIINNSN